MWLALSLSHPLQNFIFSEIYLSILNRIFVSDHFGANKQNLMWTKLPRNMKVRIYNTVPILGLLPPPETPQRKNRYCSGDVLTRQNFWNSFSSRLARKTLLQLMSWKRGNSFWSKGEGEGNWMSKYGINCKNVWPEKASASCKIVVLQYNISWVSN